MSGEVARVEKFDGAIDCLKSDSSCAGSLKSLDQQEQAQKDKLPITYKEKQPEENKSLAKQHVIDNGVKFVKKHGMIVENPPLQ